MVLYRLVQPRDTHVGTISSPRGWRIVHVRDCCSATLGVSTLGVAPHDMLYDYTANKSPVKRAGDSKVAVSKVLCFLTKTAQQFLRTFLYLIVYLCTLFMLNRKKNCRIIKHFW